MITEEELLNEPYKRFPGNDIESSACRGAWRYGAEWTIDRLDSENEKLKAENDLLKALLGSIISVSDEEKAMHAAYRNYEDEVYAAIKAAKKDLK